MYGSIPTPWCSEIDMPETSRVKRPTVVDCECPGTRKRTRRFWVENDMQLKAESNALNAPDQETWWGQVAPAAQAAPARDRGI